jgi:hypothetical protein
LRRYLLDTTPLAAYPFGRPQPGILSDQAHQGLHQGCDISCPRAFGTATGDPVEVIAIDAFKTQSVERTAEFGVLLNGIRQEMLDLETDDRICLGVDSCKDEVAIPASEQDARGWARLSVEVDEKRVRRPIVRKSHLI